MKKLVLYSDQIAPETDEIDRHLLSLIAQPTPTMGYIPSCSDPQRGYFQRQQAYYGRYGITMPVYFELDEAYQPELLDRLFACDGIHLTGGNTYYFLYWLRKRGLMPRLRRYVAQGGVLVGVSAGAILMTPDISTTALCGDDPAQQPDDLSGLHLVDFAFVPHVGENPLDLSVVQTYSRDRQAVVYACPDGAGIVVEDDQVRCIGEMMMIVNGDLCPLAR